MIDRRKNLCYIITIHYLAIDGNGEYKSRSCDFISLHGINTKRCKKFAHDYVRRDPQFHRLEEEWGSQRTISNSQYCK
ncbi:hypothetical protein [Exiguobacterium sp.]|uniref:hypothetical protein n=1 Tax=Exiguobacterium sp. TaxID=44751 RepID=UPI00289B846B|nr:hypothetical protein [Exiguobacterium sp.]